jgi:hypothetical protein
VSGSGTPVLAPANVLGAPASSLAGISSILAVVTSALSHGVPTDAGGWITFGVSVLAGIGAIFAKAS